MKSIALRKEVQQYISRADDRFLRMVYSMAEEYARHEHKVIGYQKGKALKRSQLLADLEMAESEIKGGKGISIEDLESESEKW